MTRIFGHYVATEIAVLLGLEAAISFVAFAGLSYLWLVPEMSQAANHASHAWQVVALATMGTAIATCVLAAVGLYRSQTALRMRDLLLNAAVGAGLAIVPLMLVVYVSVASFGLRSPNPMWISRTLFAWIACVTVTRIVMKAAVEAGFCQRRILILGDSGPDATAATAPGANMRVTRWTDFGSLPPPQRLAADNVNMVVLGHEDEPMPAPEWLMACRRLGMSIETRDEYLERRIRRLNTDRLKPGWLSTAPGYPPSPAATAARRIADVAIGASVLLAASPVMIATAIAIRMEGDGPIIYSQPRVGLDGEVFRIYKFRSMRTDAEAKGAVWATTGDSRVTKVGAFIRRTRIDELPQLANVIGGSMSVIGPRPERPEFVGMLAERIPRYMDRHVAKPGVTGWAQVNFPYGSTVEDARTKLSYDLYYVKNRSPFLDLVILLQTFRVMAFLEGSR